MLLPCATIEGGDPYGRRDRRAGARIGEEERHDGRGAYGERYPGGASAVRSPRDVGERRRFYGGGENQAGELHYDTGLDGNGAGPERQGTAAVRAALRLFAGEGRRLFRQTGLSHGVARLHTAIHPELHHGAEGEGAPVGNDGGNGAEGAARGTEVLRKKYPRRAKSSHGMRKNRQ